MSEFSAEILNEWYTFLPSKDALIAKFAANAGRMERNFNCGNQRCGFYEDQLPHGDPERERREADDSMDRYNREDPSETHLNKSLLVSASGLSVTFHNALANVNTNIKLIA